MYTEIEHYLDSTSLDSAEQKKMIAAMVAVLEPEQLAQVIDFLRKPFFTRQLKDYLIDSKLPDTQSKEFQFLIQAAKYDGNIVRKIMNGADISNYYLDKFIDKYHLKEISPGSYIFPQKKIDASFLFQVQYSKSIISHESALYMLDLTDVIPKKMIMSMPKDYKLSQLEKRKNEFIQIYYDTYNGNKSLVICYQDNDPIFLTKNTPIDVQQIVNLRTTSHNPVRVTSEERTIADILAPNSNVEEEVKQMALVKYHQKHSQDMVRLRRIAAKQNVLTEVDNYLTKLKIY